jgi:hypothetical protein
VRRAYLELVSAGLAVLFGALPGEAAAACGSAPARTGFVVGVGEGETRESAKHAALADLAGFFGTRIDARSSLTEEGVDASSVQLRRSVEARVQAIVKGAEVLEECSTDAGRRITVGLRKTQLRALLERQATRRQAWVDAHRTALGAGTADDATLDAARSLLAEERADVEAWTLSGAPVEALATLRADDRRALLRLEEAAGRRHRRVQLASVGLVAETTAIAVTERLRTLQIEVAPDASETWRWSCTLDRGVAIRGNARFQATCRITGEGARAVTVQVSGIAPEGAVEATAARLVAAKLRDTEGDGS